MMRRRLRFVAACSAALVVVAGAPANAIPPGGPGEPSEDDTTAPVIRVQAPEGAWQGWYRQPATIKISATDTGTGLKDLTWTITGAQPGSGSGNNVSTLISTQGVSEFAITAVDFEGNTSTAKYGVGIDTEAPQITLGGSATDNMVVQKGAKRTITYSCTDNLTGVSLCTGDFVSGAEVPTDTVGQKSVEMRALDQVDNRSTRTIRYTVVESALQQATAPTIAGQERVGSTLTASGATFSPAADSVSYQWFRDGTPVAIGSTYTLTHDDRAKVISVVATGRKAGFADGTTTPRSTGRIQNAPFVITGEAALEGTPAVGSTLSLRLPTISPTPTAVTYYWYRDDSPIEGASGREYRLTPDDAGAVISVNAWIEASAYESTWIPTIWSTPVVPSALGVAQAPAITGTPRIGYTLQAVPPVFNPAATSLAYQWLRDGVPIPGATAHVYSPGVGDVGRAISVRVTGARQQYAGAATVSAATVRVAKIAASASASVKARGKKRVRVTVTVRTPGIATTGTVTVKRGSKVVARGKRLKNGRVTINLSRQKKGRTRYTVVYSGSNTAEPRTVRTKTVRVR
jgi:hypothetical protein